MESLQWSQERQREHFRVFPLSNWTELDIWQYIQDEQIDLPSLYFTHRRDVIKRDGMILAVSDVVRPVGDEQSRTK